MNQHVKAENWLLDSQLTEEGKLVREEYSALCDYLSQTGLQSFQAARAKYFLNRFNYWTLPNGYSLPPHTINLCVNNICNLRCRFCDFGQKNTDTFYHQYNVVDANKTIELPLDLCKRIVDESKWFRPIIRVSFREPMLYKDIFPLIEHTKTNGLPFWLLTNGFNLAKYARQLVTLGVDSIRLSVDGNESVHDACRGVAGAYRRMLDGVKTLIAEVTRNTSKMQIGFYFTLNDTNYDKLLATVEQLDKESVLSKVFLNFQWLLYTTERMAREHNASDAEICDGRIDESTCQNVDLAKIDIDTVAKQATEIRQRFSERAGYRIHFRPSFELDDLKRYLHSEKPPVSDPRCRVPWYNININPLGDVKPFHHCLLPSTGNVMERSILDVWNGDSFRNQRRLLKVHGAYRGCARCWGIYSLLDDTKRKSTVTE